MLTNLSSYIGLPYLSHGRSEKGLDCWGLVRLVLAKELGKELPDNGELYKVASDPFSVSNAIENYNDFTDQINYEERQKYDIILFLIKGQPVHMGMVVDKNTMLHTLKGHNSCLEKYTSFMWKKRIEGIYRVK